MHKVLITDKYWKIRCRACGSHYIPREEIPNKTWRFNGDCFKPTFTPSINESVNPVNNPDYNPDAKSSRCHFIITDGKIYYCNDCTHKYAGESIELEPFSETEIKLHNFDNPKIL